MPVGKLYQAPVAASTLGPKVINNPFLEADAKRLEPVKRNFVVPTKVNKKNDDVNNNNSENQVGKPRPLPAFLTTLQLTVLVHLRKYTFREKTL